MAEGRSNQAIADRMFVTLRAVEKHVTSIFTKLDLPAAATTIAACLPCSRSCGTDVPRAARRRRPCILDGTRRGTLLIAERRCGYPHPKDA